MAAAFLTNPKAHFYDDALRAVFLGLLQGFVGMIVFEDRIGGKNSQRRVFYNPMRNMLSENTAVLIPVLFQDNTACFDASALNVEGASLIVGSFKKRTLRSNSQPMAPVEANVLRRQLAARVLKCRSRKNHFNMAVFIGTDGNQQHVLIPSNLNGPGVNRGRENEKAGP